MLSKNLGTEGTKEDRRERWPRRVADFRISKRRPHLDFPSAPHTGCLPIGTQPVTTSESVTLLSVRFLPAYHGLVLCMTVLHGKRNQRRESPGVSTVGLHSNTSCMGYQLCDLGQAILTFSISASSPKMDLEIIQDQGQ